MKTCVPMSSKLGFRITVLPSLALVGLAFAACSDYGSDPQGPMPGDPSTPGAGGTDSAGAPVDGTAMGGSSSQGDMTIGGLAGGASGGAANTGTDGPPLAVGGGDGTGAGGTDGAGGSGAVVTRPEGSCDIYAAAGTPCIAAYSMVRALSSTYTGALYQVRRGAPNPLQNTGTGGETLDIGILPNGFADRAAQDAFCGTQPCTVSVLFDQSGQGSNLTVAKAGCYIGTASEDDFESSATDVPLTVGGNPVYGLFMRPHEGYRNNVAMNTPEGEDAMGIYSVAAGSGTRPNPPPACCWNFGIASRDNCYGPTGMMNALFFGRAFWGEGAGDGPWFMGDFEAGVWAGGTAGGIGREDLGPFDVNPANPSMTMDYAFGVLKSAPNNYALRMGDAQQGTLTTAWDGPTPLAMTRWQMEGGIILGIGGDNSNSSQGTFFEGAITAGRPSNETDEAVFANVQAAGYGQ
jgi:hypothetical protein